MACIGDEQVAWPMQATTLTLAQIAARSYACAASHSVFHLPKESLRLAYKI